MRDEVFATVQRHMAGPFRHVGGGNVLTRCPFHKEGQEHKPSFSINLEKAVFHCFTCHVAGGIQYLLHLLGLPRARIDLELAVIRPIIEANRKAFQLEKRNVFRDADPFKADYVLPEALLGVYEFAPTKLLEQGFDINLLRDLEVGFDRKSERIMYPLRDVYGNLAGFSGGAQYAEQFPKYKVYEGRRKVDRHWVPGDFGEWFDEQFPDYRCENHDFLWNFHRVYPRILGMSDPSSTVFIVEGFKACMWMLQAGYLNTVALMGSYISDRQQMLLHRLDTNVVLMLDNDKAGREAAARVGELLWKPMHSKVTIATYPSEDFDTQPDDYHPEGLHYMVQHLRMSVGDYIRLETSRNPDFKRKLEEKRAKKEKYQNANERGSTPA